MDVTEAPTSASQPSSAAHRTRSDRQPALARMGGWCFDHRRVVLSLWLVFVLAGFTLGGTVLDRFSDDGANDSWESKQASAQLAEAAPYGERLLAVVDGTTADDPAIRSAVQAAGAAIAAHPAVARVTDAYAVSSPDLRSTDGRTQLITVDLRKELAGDEHDQAVSDVELLLRGIAADAPVQVTLGGAVLFEREFDEQTERDTRTSELIALPLTLLIMVFVFRGVAAAGVPVLAAVASIASGLLALLGWTYALGEVDSAVLSVTTVLGLGLSIDYALLVVSRYREERGKGCDPRSAVVATVAASGRTVLFSGITVAVSLAGLFVFPTPFLRGIGAAGLSVVLLAVLAALTLTPALLAVLHRRISAPSEPIGDEGFFTRLARAVQRRPLVVAISVAGLLLVAGTPFLHATFQNGEAETLPVSAESRRFADLLSQRFPGRGAEPVVMVARAPLERVQAYAAELTLSPNIRFVRPPEQQGDLVVLEVVPHGASQGEQARALVAELRAADPGFPAQVTGLAAILVDFNAEVGDHLAAALAVVAAATFVLLSLMTGSVVIPIKALIMNTLSLGASFGVLVWGFQDGNLAEVLGFTPTGGLETWVPVITFALAFGLSMDYEVFLLSRIKELRDAGYDDNTAVAVGLQRTAPIITAAALLMITVFAAFAAGQVLGIKQLGVALTVAVLVDATLIRFLLVPATMTLLGRWNWWAPAPLRRLHQRFGLQDGT